MGSIFSNNSATYGGAVSSEEGYLKLSGNIFENNLAEKEGGAIVSF